MDLNKINQNIDVLLDFNNKYESKKEKIKGTPVKLSRTCICGATSSLIAMFSMDNHFLSGTLLASLGGYAIGCTIPYIIKKIRIADLDYQIYMNDKIINDLKNEKAKIIRR